MSRDSRLFDETLNALRAGGNVLIPVDSGSRVLEICLAFDRHWGTKSRGRGAYNLALFCPLHKSMLGIAQQNMNFMSEELSDQVVPFSLILHYPNPIVRSILLNIIHRAYHNQSLLFAL